MALGTPTDGGTAYSTAGGTTVSPAYPANIAANDVLVLVVGQKPNAANGGTLTDPNGWTRREFATGGGYGTTLGQDTGNTNLYFLTKDVVAGTETGNLSVTIGTNNVSWAVIVRIPGGGGTSFGYATAEGSRDTTPTSPLQVTMGTDPGFTAGDMAIFSMCVPTDAIAGTFDTWDITQSGVTFATGVELEEPDSGVGNDIGGTVAYASCSTGTSTAAPRVDFTIAGGTITNVRGPVVVLRVRDTSQPLTPDLYTNTQTFYQPTVTPGTVTLTPDLYTNDQTFYSPDVTQSGGVQNLDPALYTNDQTFYAPTVATTYSLTPDLYTNVQTFYGPTIAATYSIEPALYTNDQTFYSPTVSQAGQAQDLTPDLYTNTQTFYSATVTTTYDIAPLLFSNTQTFYSPTVSQTGAPQDIAPDLYTNSQTFFALTLAATYSLECQDYVDPGYVDPPGYVNWSAFNNNIFFSPTVTATPAPVVILDGHEGDKNRRKRRWDEETERRERRRAEIQDIFERVVEGKRDVAATIVAPYAQISPKSDTIRVDYDRLLADIDRVDRLYREYQELDDEEVLLLL